MSREYKNPFSYKVIYVFTIEYGDHRGLVKIGDAILKTSTSIDALAPNSRELNQAAHERIREYTNTAGVPYTLRHTELAFRMVPDQDGNLTMKAFRDHDVHAVLKNSGIKKVCVGNTTGQEWFEIDVETAKKAIAAVKDNMSNLSNADIVKQPPIILRPEQIDCIEKAVKHFQVADRFLINAKMRFGKTFVSLEIVKRCLFEKTIILTHRPVVDAGWYEDFTKIFYGCTDYMYGSKMKGGSLDSLLASGKKFVYFASVQDLRGSAHVSGKHAKNDRIFEAVWDCVIVDEAHEGTTTALGEGTIKAVVKEHLGKTKFLALSGTPFNILGEYDADAIYSWDYIMEQERKAEWDKLHFGDSNPYEELPALCIYTYSLGDILHNGSYTSVEDKAFNFHEFFRTWTGDPASDDAAMPLGASIGDFVHEGDIVSFLNLMTARSEESYYPFSTEEYRSLFRHSLWMVPGVKAARALKKLMMKHPVFGSGMFDIVNVAGSGDEEEKAEEALSKVRSAIKKAGDHYTITLSCGKLTTGVTVKEWTAVFMLSGSYSTSATNYLQTIFRVQSPCNDNGKIKDTAYVFDFAPDRALKMVSQAVSVSAKAGKTKVGDKKIIGKFLNYCPVISITGSQMQEYNADKLLQQLKKAYAEKVVRSGFYDASLYNDELFKLQDVDIQKFDALKGIIAASKAAPKTKDITINEQGLTNEEYEETERLKKKPRAQLSPEEKARLEELKKTKKLRNDAISILRGISIRMPLLIYGADVPYDQEITLDRFVDMVDTSSWDEFMPIGVTKEKFREFQKYYDEEVFIAAGRHIRDVSRDADALSPTERVKRIAALFSTFKNPDKETVLTPWRVVNMHLSDCIGGWDFWDETHEETRDEPRFVDRGKVTADIFGKPDSHILEINSKTGLYPLYAAYSVFRERWKDFGPEELTLDKQRALWAQVVNDNIFVICKTPMAKAITQRTLMGYTSGKINAHYFENLINTMQNKPQQFVEKILKESYWKKGDGKIMFDAVIGNPPYMEIDNGAQASAKPVYQHFVNAGKRITSTYMSVIIPTRWYTGGKGLDDFRDSMLNDIHIEILHDFLDPSSIFPNTNIRGGVCYFLWNKQYDSSIDLTSLVTHSSSGVINKVSRTMRVEGSGVFIRDFRSVSIIKKVVDSCGFKSISEQISPRKPFGVEGSIIASPKFHNTRDGLQNPLKCYGKGKTVGYIEESFVRNHLEWIDSYKVYMPYANNIGTELSDDNQNTFVGKPKSVCTETFIMVGHKMNLTLGEARNLSDYLKTKFARFLLSTAKSSQHATSKAYVFVPMQDFSKPWTDEELYAKYGLSDEEIDFIESIIRPMNTEATPPAEDAP